MTRPNKENGVPVAFKLAIEQRMAAGRNRGCESKRRFPDEWCARAAGIERMAQNDVQLFIYQCRHCRGWHLTQREAPPYFAVDYLLKGGYK